jgi:hypothetical protein
MVPAGRTLSQKILNDDELADGYNFNFRSRYNILLQFALGKQPFKPGTFSFVLSDEVFVNLEKKSFTTPLIRTASLPALRII